MIVLSKVIDSIITRWELLKPLVASIMETVITAKVDISARVNQYRDAFLVSADVWSLSLASGEVPASRVPYIDGLRALSTIKRLDWDAAMVNTKTDEFFSRWGAVMSYPIEFTNLRRNSPEQHEITRNQFFKIFVKHGIHSVPLLGLRLATHDVVLVSSELALPDQIDLGAVSRRIQQSFSRYDNIVPHLTVPGSTAEAELPRILDFIRLFLRHKMDQIVDVAKLAPELVQFHDWTVYLTSSSGRSDNEVANGALIFLSMKIDNNSKMSRIENDT